MSDAVNRRHFLMTAAASGAALSLGANGRADEPAANKVVVAVVGTGGRGTGLAQEFAKLPGVAVSHVCDVDAKRVENAAGAVAKTTKGTAPKTVADFRRILDDKSIDAIVVATPNHWHAPAAILGCSAGKHVYVEKPCSQNPREGELLVEAARKNKRLVQMGNQRRSFPKVIEAVELVRGGGIGRAYLAQAWYTNSRGSIGKGKETQAPAGLDYDLWQGPAPRRAFHDNYLHYNWHWFWHWGNGELGNNGIHMIDVCRWGLGAEYPVRVTSTGGRYRYEDDQETPDTHLVSFEFDGRKAITWQGLSCNQLPDGQKIDILFHGENGSLAISGSNYRLYDAKGKEIKKVDGPGGEPLHFGNFIEAVRGNKPLNSEITEGHRSTLLCHLGNISHRTGRALRCDPKTGHVLGDSEAMTMWSREYAKGFEPVV
jgi:predicted dehydrogenase